MNAISKQYASHDMNNTSDHELVTIQFDIQADRFSASVRKFAHKVVWHKASHADIEHYRQTVHNALGNFVIPLPLCYVEMLNVVTRLTRWRLIRMLVRSLKH